MFSDLQTAGSLLDNSASFNDEQDDNQHRTVADVSFTVVATKSQNEIIKLTTNIIFQQKVP